MSQADEPEPGDMPGPLQTRAGRLWPFDWYAEQRDQGELRWDDDRGCWDAFSHAAVQSVLTDHETFSSQLQADDESGVFGDSMLFSDQPRHTDLREPVTDFFTPGAVKALEPEIRQNAAALLDDVIDAETGQFDLVDALSYPLPIVTIAALIGVPTEDRQQFKEWSDRVVNVPQMSGEDTAAAEARNETARDDLVAYFVELLEARRAEPRDDLVSKLVHETDLDEYDMLTTTALLLVAGNVTTTNLITNAVRCFVEHDCVDQVTADEESLSRAIEEVLRFRSPVQRTARVATADTTVGDRAVAKGDTVICWLGAAHRDPTVFDQPHEFVPDRSPNPHMAFGRGIHICLGAPLARLEARIALDVLFDRVDTLDIVETKYDPIPSSFLYGVQSFPVAYESS